MIIKPYLKEYLKQDNFHMNALYFAKKKHRKGYICAVSKSYDYGMYAIRRLFETIAQQTLSKIATLLRISVKRCTKGVLR